MTFERISKFLYLSASHKNGSIDLLFKSIYWFLYDTSRNNNLFASILYYGRDND